MQENTWEQYIRDWFSQQKPCLDFAINKRDKLSDNGAKGILNAFQQIHQKIKYIKMFIGGSRFKVEGCKSLGEAIGCCQNLISLDIVLKANNIKHTGMKELANGISKCERLEDFSFEIQKKNNIGIEGGRSLGICISKLKSLKRLMIYIQDTNGLQSQGLIEFGEFAGQCTNLKELHLQIDKNDINPEGIKGIELLLKNMTNLSKLVLIMKDNNIGDTGSYHLKNGFSELKSLLNLNLSITDSKISDKGWYNILSGIGECEKLSSFYFKPYDQSYSLQNFKSQGCLALKSIFSQCQQLKYVQLLISFCQINDEACLQLGQSLQEAQSVQKLSIQMYGNPYTSDGLCQIFKRLEKLTDLKSISFKQSSSVYVNQFFTYPIFTSLQKLENLKVLNLKEGQFKKITSDQIPLIVNCIKQLNQLIDIRLNLKECNTLTPNDIYTLFECFKEKKHLIFLCLLLKTTNEIPVRLMKDQMSKILLKSKRLVKLTLYVDYKQIF